MSTIFKPNGTRKAKVFLGVGHGGSDPGAVGYIREADVNLNMALAEKDYLVANGVEVCMSRIRDENDTLKEEIRECNAYGPDVCHDNHNNAGKGDGAEFYYSIGNERGKLLGLYMQEELAKIGQNTRKVTTRANSSGTDYYGFIRQTRATAVISEGVFVDNWADASQADTLEEQRAFGYAYARATLRWLGLPDNGFNGAPTGAGEQYSIKTAEDGLFGPDCVRKSQTVYHTHVDGKISNQPIGNKKCLPNVASGVWEFKPFSRCGGGSALIKAIQKDLKEKGYYAGAIDGWCGVNTVKAIQRFLRDLELYAGDIDGSMGPKTVLAWQRYINSRL